MKHLALAFLGLALAPLAACELTPIETNPTTTTTGTTTVPNDLVRSPLISECGGFIKQTKVDPPTPDPTTYCDAERLLWVYDAATESLGLTDARMMLNCCGEHSIDVALDNGVYVVTELDSPEILGGSPARCNCDCVFDFAISVEPVPAGTIQIRLVRDVTDSGADPKILYEGSLDLTPGSGSITLDATSAEPWCSQ